VNIKDLRHKIFKDKKGENSLWLKKESPQLLLMDRRSWTVKVIEHEWKYFNKCKLENTEYFKILRLCQDFVERKISLRRNLNIFPYYKRGTKGFALSDNAMSLMPKHIQEKYNLYMVEKDSKLVLFKDVYIALSKSDFKFVK